MTFIGVLKIIAIFRPLLSVTSIIFSFSSLTWKLLIIEGLSDKLGVWIISSIDFPFTSNDNGLVNLIIFSFLSFISILNSILFI